MTTIRSTTATYVQAWECTKAHHVGLYVYTQALALDRLAQHFDVEAVTIIRHDTGAREYLPGTLVREVFRHRTQRDARTGRS